MRKLSVCMLCFVAILEFTSCAISETESASKHYTMTFSGNRNHAMKLFIQKGAGTYAEVLPIENRYVVDIDRMQGGYSSFMGIHFNKHIPEEYKVLRIMDGKEIVKELSIVDIEYLKKDDNGNYLLDF